MNIKLHTESITTKDELENNYFHVAYDLPKDNLYYFFISIKKNWRLIKINIVEPTEKLPGTKIALFQRIEEPYAEIDVEAFIVPQDIHPVDYLDIWLSSQQYELVDRKVFKTDYGLIGDYLYKLVFEEKIFICRSLTIKDGNRIFIITCRSENTINEIINEEFLIALQSFRLLNPTQERFADKYTIYNVAEPLSLSFLYPESWRVKEDELPVPNSVSVNFKNINADNQVTGSISFVAVPKSIEPVHNDLYLYYLKQLKDNGVMFDKTDLTELETEENNKQWLANIPCSINQSQYEIVVSILEQYDTLFFTALLGIAKSNDQVLWAFNKKAFFNMTESIQLIE